MPTYEDAAFGGKFVFGGEFLGSDTCCGGEIHIKVTIVLLSGTFASNVVKVSEKDNPKLFNALTTNLKKRVELACVHRSELPIERSSCGKYNVYDCEIHERCVIRRYPRTDPSFASCSDCADYTRKSTTETL